MHMVSRSNCPGDYDQTFFSVYANVSVGVFANHSTVLFAKGIFAKFLKFIFFAYFDRLLCPSCIGEKKSLDTLNFRPDMML